MKVSLFTMPTVPATTAERLALKPIGRNSERYQAMIQELRELVVLLDDLGYDAFSTTEHHFHTEGGEALPNTVLLYTHLASITRRISFIPMSIVLPSNNPIRVAEDIALFDNMFPGRIGVAFARGYQKRWVPVLSQTGAIALTGGPEADALGREIYDEYLEIIHKAWNEDAFSHDGKFFKIPFPFEGIQGWAGTDWTNTYGSPGELDEHGVIRKIGVVPRPTRPLQLFVPANVSPQTVINAARTGTVPVFHEGRRARLRELMELFQSSAREAGRGELRLGEGIGVLRTICLGDSYDEAFDYAARSAGHIYHDYFNEFGFAEIYRTAADDPDKPVAFASQEECAARMIETGQVLCGTPNDVKQQFAAQQEDGRFDWLFWSHFGQGTVSQEESHKQVTMFARDVWPAFK